VAVAIALHYTTCDVADAQHDALSASGSEPPRSRLKCRRKTSSSSAVSKACTFRAKRRSVSVPTSISTTHAWTAPLGYVIFEIRIWQARKQVVCLRCSNAHAFGPELALAHLAEWIARAVAEFGNEVCPQRGCLQVVVNEDVVQPIESPLLNGQRRSACAVCDEWNRLMTQRIQKWSATTEHPGDGQLYALEVIP
jgi:hypothetical protein